MSEPVKKLREYFSYARVEQLIDEDAMTESERFLNEPIEASVVIARCGLCGWFNSFPSLRESPATCPTCSSNLTVRDQTDEIFYPL